MHFRVSSSKDWALSLNCTEIGGELCIDGPASSIQYNTFRAGWYVMSRCYYALYMEGESRRRSSCLYGWIKQPQPRVFIYLSLFDRLASADIKRPYISDDYSWCFNSFLLLTAIWNNIKNKNKIKSAQHLATVDPASNLLYCSPSLFAYGIGGQYAFRKCTTAGAFNDSWNEMIVSWYSGQGCQRIQESLP